MTAGDPTAVVTAAQGDERARLRVEVERLKRALVTAYIEVEVLKIDRDRWSRLGDELFVEGYDQAVREIRSYFAETKQAAVVSEIEEIWLKDAPS